MFTYLGTAFINDEPIGSGDGPDTFLAPRQIRVETGTDSLVLDEEIEQDIEVFDETLGRFLDIEEFGVATFILGDGSAREILFFSEGDGETPPRQINYLLEIDDFPDPGVGEDVDAYLTRIGVTNVGPDGPPFDISSGRVIPFSDFFGLELVSSTPPDTTFDESLTFDAMVVNEVVNTSDADNVIEPSRRIRIEATDPFITLADANETWRAIDETEGRTLTIGDAFALSAGGRRFFGFTEGDSDAGSTQRVYILQLSGPAVPPPVVGETTADFFAAFGGEVEDFPISTLDIDDLESLDAVEGEPAEPNDPTRPGDEIVEPDFSGEPADATVVGDGGDERLVGRDEVDTRIEGGAGNDTLIDRSGNNLLFGEEGEDRIVSGDGNDRVDGGEDRDVVKTFGGSDVIVLGAGDDVALSGTEDDTVFGGAGDDVIKTSTGEDVIFGGDGADIVFGWRGEDTIFGGEGDDVLRGDFDADTIEGGAGDDRIVAGPGRDTLVFREGFEEDRVLDFRIGSDVLDFSAHVNVLALADLTISQIGTSTVIDDGTGGRLVLANIEAADLTDDQFIF